MTQLEFGDLPEGKSFRMGEREYFLTRLGVEQAQKILADRVNWHFDNNSLYSRGSEPVRPPTHQEFATVLFAHRAMMTEKMSQGTFDLILDKILVAIRTEE